MNYHTEISKIRNYLHKGLVQESTVNNILNGYDNGFLKTTTPIIVGQHNVEYLCTETGLLLSTDGDTIVRYKDLSVEELIVLHDSVVVKKEYSFTNHIKQTNYVDK